MEVTSTFPPNENNIKEEIEYEHEDSSSTSTPTTFVIHRPRDHQHEDEDQHTENPTVSTVRGIRTPDSPESISGEYFYLLFFLSVDFNFYARNC